jgi:hypothetical protein
MRSIMLTFLALSLAASLPAQTTPAGSRCVPVGGVLFTNINVVAGTTNMGPVYGDLKGSVAATIVSVTPAGITVQHYWVTDTGETIEFKPALLKPVALDTKGAIVAVPYGSYKSEIAGGTGIFKGATGTLEYLGMADFTANHLVLRYRGEVCYAQ